MDKRQKTCLSVRTSFPPTKRYISDSKRYRQCKTSGPRWALWRVYSGTPAVRLWVLTYCITSCACDWSTAAWPTSTGVLHDEVKGLICLNHLKQLHYRPQQKQITGKYIKMNPNHVWNMNTNAHTHTHTHAHTHTRLGILKYCILPMFGWFKPFIIRTSRKSWRGGNNMQILGID